MNRKGMLFMDFSRSTTLLKKARKIIPGGLFGHFKFPALIQEGSFPVFVKYGEGCYFYDADDHKYIDYINGFGANLLGYNFNFIERFVADNRTKGDCFGLPKEIYVTLVEEIVNTFDSIEWAALAKNGADVTSLAVVAARAYTGKRKMVGIKGGFHGSHINWGWCIPGPGRFPEDYDCTLLGDWNDAQQMEQIFKEHGKEIACIIITPILQQVYGDSIFPDPAFLSTIRRLCDQYDAVFIVDDVRTGLHLDMRGSDRYFDFKADMLCMSKALGNTYSMACLGGREKFYQAAERIFFSGTFWGLEQPILASLATLKFAKEHNVIEHLMSMGTMLTEGIEKLADTFSIPVKVSGPKSMPYLRFLDDAPGTCDRAFDFAAQSSKNGVFIHPFHNWCLTYSHTKDDIENTLTSMEDAFRHVKNTYY